MNMPQPNRTKSSLAAVRLTSYVLALLALNGCAALAVSLAGAGAGAGLSHQMNGTATRTFSQPFDKVDNASRMAAKHLFLEIDEIATTETGQITKARVGDMDIKLELEPLSPQLTRVSVNARKDLFRVDGATAQEIVVQIERALAKMDVATASASKTSKFNGAKYTPPATTTKSVAQNKTKGTI